MKVGDRVRRKKENHRTGQWDGFSRGKRVDRVCVISEISNSTASFVDEQGVWMLEYFEPVEQTIFNDIIDLYYEGRGYC